MLSDKGKNKRLTSKQYEVILNDQHLRPQTAQQLWVSNPPPSHLKEKVNH